MTFPVPGKFNGISECRAAHLARERFPFAMVPSEDKTTCQWTRGGMLTWLEYIFPPVHDQLVAELEYLPA